MQILMLVFLGFFGFPGLLDDTQNEVLVDLGELDGDESRVEKTAQFLNPFKDSIRIKVVENSCSCIASRFPEGQIAAGEIVKFELKISPKSQPVLFERKLRLTVDSAGYEHVILIKLRAKLVRRQVFIPEKVAWNIDPGSINEPKITVVFANFLQELTPPKCEISLGEVITSDATVVSKHSVLGIPIRAWELHLTLPKTDERLFAVDLTVSQELEGRQVNARLQIPIYYRTPLRLRADKVYLLSNTEVSNYIVLADPNLKFETDELLVCTTAEGKELPVEIESITERQIKFKLSSNIWRRTISESQNVELFIPRLALNSKLEVVCDD